MKLSIVIPTWNGLALLRPCLESVRAQTWQDFEIIVSDDGSTDGTDAWLAASYPEVVVLRSERNLGFVAAANRGIVRAQGAWLFLLNNDVTLAEDCLAHLMAAADQNQAAMLAPVVLWTAEPQLVYSAGDQIGKNGRPNSVGYGLVQGSFTIRERPFGVSGGYGLFRSDLLDRVGILDPAFGAYFEDADLCFRARWAGFDALLVPEARAWHVGSASIQGRTWWRTRQCYRNHALLVIKNFSIRMLIWNASPLLAERRHQTRRLFNAARHEWGTLRAVAQVAMTWVALMARVPGALVQRRQILRNRKLSDEAMQALLMDGESHV